MMVFLFSCLGCRNPSGTREDSDVDVKIHQDLAWILVVDVNIHRDLEWILVVGVKIHRDLEWILGRWCQYPPWILGRVCQYPPGSS